ncbi:MAG: hypothetical protein HPY59_15295 [Anaerolineae bacterium]|nr:hypothetical protein [Anaerolineae bacterium]
MKTIPWRCVKPVSGQNLALASWSTDDLLADHAVGLILTVLRVYPENSFSGM